MTISFAWLQGSAGVPSYPAKSDRQIIAAIFDEGVIRGCKATPSGVDRVITVGKGQCVVTGDDSTGQGNYVVSLDGADTITMTAAPGGGSRIDLVVIRIKDTIEGGPAGNTVILDKVDGTASGSPVAPAVPASCFVVAQTLIAAGQTAITTGMVTDRRVFTEPKQAVGSVKMWLGSAARIPVGWALLNAQVLGLFSNFPDLADLLNVTSGSITLPADTQGRALVGVQAADPSWSAVGVQAGAKTSVIAINNMPSHSHPFSTGTESAAHRHDGFFGQFMVPSFGGDTARVGGSGMAAVVMGTEDALHTHSGTTGNTGGTPDGLSVLQPSVALYVIVRVL